MILLCAQNMCATIHVRYSASWERSFSAAGKERGGFVI